MKAHRPGYVDSSTVDPADLIADEYSVAFGSDPGDIVAAFSPGPSTLLPRLLAARPAWLDDAACAGMPVAVFYERENKREALQTCGGCPVRQPCLDEAIADPELDHGIRGGMTAAARKAHRRAIAARQRANNGGNDDGQVAAPAHRRSAGDAEVAAYNSEVER
jgi:WhiB family redox-sensing transcriptional regulator